MRNLAGLGVVCAALVICCSGDNAQTNDAGPDATQSNDASTESGGDSSAQNDGTTTSDTGGPTSNAFPSSSIFYQDISQAKVDSAWQTILTNAFANGWGGPFQLDPSFEIN